MSGTIVAVSTFSLIFLLWLLAEMKTSRPDGVFLKDTPKFRRMMLHLMPGPNVSNVLFDAAVDATELLEYLPEAREKFGADMTHAAVAALGIGFHENPRMNRFVAGKRLYQRNGVHVTFSMKRKKMDRKSGVAIQKLEIPADETFREFVERVEAKINYQRSGEKTYTDKELDVFDLLPRPVLAMALGIAKRLNYYNLLPASFVENDDMFCSGVIANLGSLKMGAGYHHLYDWGTCPLFIMVGQLEHRPVVVGGEVVVKPILPVRFNYDERIDDGLNARFGIDSVVRALENPREYLGCLSDDGSDARPFLPLTERG